MISVDHSIRDLRHHLAALQSDGRRRLALRIGFGASKMPSSQSAEGRQKRYAGSIPAASISSPAESLTTSAGAFQRRMLMSRRWS
jgi:hypothetical protein